jgi:hypothetical protein
MIYELGHIYMIWDIDDHNLVYYGSTCDLNYRIRIHKCLKTNNCTSKQIIERGNYKYAILETHENIDEYDLRERERWYIKNKPCVNEQIPNRTDAEYYQDNKEKIAEQTKKYRQDNKEKIAERNKEYRQDNKEKIAEKMNKKFVCECGGKFTKANAAQYKKSKKHLKWIQSCKI